MPSAQFPVNFLRSFANLAPGQTSLRYNPSCPTKWYKFSTPPPTHCPLLVQHTTLPNSVAVQFT